MNRERYQEEWKAKDRQENKDIGIIFCLFLGVLIVVALLSGF